MRESKFDWSDAFEEEFSGQQLIDKIKEIFLIDNKEQSKHEQRTNILKTKTWWSPQSRQAQQHPKETGEDHQARLLL
jgi:hypothetical protein